MIQEEERTPRINIRLQFRSKVPLSDQVRSGIFDLIQHGVLAEDTLLPTVRELAAQLGVNFNTVARAYRALDREGWLITRQGRGTVVTKPQDRQDEDPYQASLRYLAREIAKAAEQHRRATHEILQALEQQLALPTEQENHKPVKKPRKRSAQFRAFIAAFPRSKITRRETLDWRLRKPAR